MTNTKKYVLGEDRIPKAWYNIAADLPVPPPAVLHPGTGQPIGPSDLAPLFPMAVIMQEVSTERWIEIPDPVRDIYRLWRPAPLIRAERLEKALDTPARIFFKYEGVSPAGSHKPNTAVAQAFYNKQEGVKRLTTETGAGQWGSALAFAGNLFGLEVEVYMVRVSFDQKPYRRALMETYGAKCIASPSNLTASGRAILAQNPNSSGSLGIAISEAVELAAGRDDTKYSLGSVLNHVMLHQTVIGLEAGIIYLTPQPPAIGSDGPSGDSSGGAGAPETICEMPRIRGGDTGFPVSLVCDADSKRLMLRGINEGGYACVDIDLFDVLAWLHDIAPMGVNVDDVTGALTVFASIRHSK